VEGTRTGTCTPTRHAKVEANPTYQTITTLVHLRRTHPSFPIRPYLPQLVEALEDSDGTVRDCARNSVIEIFTAPGVTDAARADLKKEMTKKNVRKTIVDTVLGKLMAAGPAVSTDAGSPPLSTATNDSDSTKPPVLSMLKRSATLSTTSSSSAGTARAIASTSTPTSERPAGQADSAPSDVPTVFVSTSAFYVLLGDSGICIRWRQHATSNRSLQACSHPLKVKRRNVTGSLVIRRYRGSAGCSKEIYISVFPKLSCMDFVTECLTPL